MAEAIAEFKLIIHEKNKVIDELKYIINQKDESIGDLKDKLRHQHEHSMSQSHSGLHTETTQKETVATKSSGPGGDQVQTHIEKRSTSVDPVTDASKYVNHVMSSEKHSDAKDQIIRDFLHIIVQQLDWRKAHTTNPIIQRLLTPTSGTYSFDDGVYNGDLILGQPNGKGRTNLTNGDFYEGEYLHGKKNGKGTYRWRNGDVYEGDHLEGQEHGKGIYRYADGDVYIGDYLHGKRHGFGMLKLKSGTTEYGYFREGQYNGKCIMISPDEQVVSIGDLKHNKQDGNWKYYNMKDSQVFINGQKVA